LPTFGEHNAQGKALRHEKPQDFSLGINPQGELSPFCKSAKNTLQIPQSENVLLSKTPCVFNALGMMMP